MLDAVIVEPALDKRTHLREIAKNFCQSVVVSSTLQDGLERVRNCVNCDVIYISSRFDLDLASAFVTSSKQTLAGRDSANLIIGSSETPSAEYLARLTLKGFDGMLVEPASVETFAASAEIALRVRKERLESRQRKSIEVMVTALADQLDELTLKMKSGQLSVLAMDRFRKLSREVANLPPAAQTTYFTALVDQFEKRPPPPAQQEAYSGASIRLQKRRILNK